MPFHLTTVATFRTPTTAWMARNYLAGLGIRAFVFDDHISTAIWTWGNATGWTKLQVETEFEQAAQQALLLRHEARELLRTECEQTQLSAHDQSSPPCMDRQPITAAERPPRKMNEKEDLVRRAKLAAVCAFILLGNAVGLPGQWERSQPGVLFFLIAMLGLIGYSTRLLWTASKSPETLQPIYESDLYWGRVMNATVYSLLALALIYVATFGYRF